jgi:hypothetical protein
METNCVLCGREVQRGGYSTKVEGVTVRPLCLECDELCSRTPHEQIVNDHREVFERMRAEKQRILVSNPESIKETAAPVLRSAREHTLTTRYNDAYRLAHTTVAIGKAMKAIGAALAVLIVIVAIFFMTQVPDRDALKVLFLGVCPAGIVFLICYGLGTLVAAVGQVLRAALDNAVNSSPFLTDDLRATVMSI